MSGLIGWHRGAQSIAELIGLLQQNICVAVQSREIVGE